MSGRRPILSDILPNINDAKTYGRATRVPMIPSSNSLAESFRVANRGTRGVIMPKPTDMENTPT